MADDITETTESTPKLIKTRTIDQLQEISTIDLSSESDYTNLLVTNGGYTKRASMTQLMSVFGTASGSGSSDDGSGSDVYDVGFFSNDTYFKEHERKGTTETEVFVVNEECTLNIHGTSTWKSVSTDPVHQMKIEISNQNNTKFFPICQKNGTGTTTLLEIDLHIRVTPGVKVKVTTAGAVAQGCSMQITQIRNHEPFTEHGSSGLVTIPTNLQQSNILNVPGNGAVKLDGTFSTTGVASTNQYDNSSNIHFMRCPSGLDETVLSNWQNMETFYLQKANTPYSWTSRRYLVNFGDKVCIRMAAKASDKSRSTAYPSNTGIVSFEATEDLPQAKTLKEQHKFMDISSVLALKDYTSFSVTIPNYKNNANTNFGNIVAAKNTIGFNHADLDPDTETSGSMYYVIRGSAESETLSNVCMVTFDTTSQESGKDHIYTPSFEQNQLSGDFYQYWSDDISAFRYSNTSNGSQSYTGNLIQINRFGSKITRLKSYCFSECSNLTSTYGLDGVLNIPPTIKNIGNDRTFCYCSKISSIVLPSSLTAFNNLCATFAWCSSLTSVNLQDIPCCNIIQYKSFIGCKNLKRIDLRHVQEVTADKIASAATNDPFAQVPLNEIIFDVDNFITGMNASPTKYGIFAFSGADQKNCDILMINGDKCASIKDKSASEVEALVKPLVNKFKRFLNQNGVTVYVCHEGISRDNYIARFTMAK